MKTMGFSKISVAHNKEGGGVLSASSPGQGTVTVEMTADEMMMFLVEVGNGLANARKEELRKRMEKELEKEKQR